MMRNLVAACAAGMCEYTVCQPVDMVATRRMLATADTARNSSILSDIRTVYQHGGIRSLYRGLGPQLLAAMPATCGMYAGERFFARLFETKDGTTTFWRTLAAGACSGVTESLAVCPFEVLKVRLQSKEYLGRYNNTAHCLRTVIAEEGLTALYKGILPHTYRNCVFNGGFFAGSYLIREHLFAPPKTPLHSFCIDFFCGTVMGTVATPAKMPFFVVKTRLQAMSSSRFVCVVSVCVHVCICICICIYTSRR